MTPKFLPLAALALVFTPAVCFGLGIRVADQNAFATARGNAFTATADNPSAVYYNPAGLTQLQGTRALLGAYSIALEASVDPAFPGSSLDTKFEVQTVPTMFISHTLASKPVSFGLGVFTPYGFGLEYPDDAPFRTLAKKGRIQYTTIHPVLAWKVLDSLSLAAGPNVSYSRVKLARGIVTPGDEFGFEGEGIGHGFSAALMWKPHRMHQFGVTYRSATTIDYSGHSRVRIPAFDVETPFGPFTVPRFEREEDADLTFEFPQTVTAGYSFRPTPDWNFEFNLDWADWDSLNALTLNQPSGSVDLPFHWKSSFMYEFGVTRYFARGFRASAGYIYSENSVPENSFNPLIPDSNRHIISFGFGQALDRFTWDLAYQYAYGPKRRIDIGTLADGTYGFKSHAVALTLGYNF